MAKARGALGRPMISREEVGYANELSYLNRIRTACLSDNRISAFLYKRISAHLQALETEFRKLGPKVVKNESES